MANDGEKGSGEDASSPLPSSLNVIMEQASKVPEEEQKPSLPTLSPYEQARADKIARNNAMLVSLGLMSKREERISNLRALGARIMYEPPKKKKRVAQPSAPPPREGSKKSLRLQGLDPSGELMALVPETPEEINEEREARLVECREARMEKALTLANSNLTPTEIEKQNSTATHEHCMMRIKTMSEKALGNRIKTIERACGKFCIIKMAVFKVCLQEKGLWDLAEEAGESLERLKAVGGEASDDYNKGKK